MIRRYEFQLWLDAQTAERILIEAILDARGEPMKSRPEFERSGKEGQVCLRGYQGYTQHNPKIQEFAQANPENFAQVLLFAPLTANTQFSRFNEWFPVLMEFLRQRDKTTVQEVGNFIAGVGGQKMKAKLTGAGYDNIRGKLLASVIDLGEGNKTQLIAHVWNERREIYKTFMDLADKKAFGEILKILVRPPFVGIQPVKAGFVVQMIFGQLGCIDTHNINIYTAMADEMSKDPSLEPEQRNKWRELGRMIAAGRAGKKKASYWQAKDKDDSASTDKISDAYLEVLRHMDRELGIDPRTLWDVWVNYVGQRYEGDPVNQYSSAQGLAFSPKDKQLGGIFGAHPTIRTGTDQKVGFTANLLQPHPTSGAVSRVHLIAAMTPDEILNAVRTQLPNKYHVINAALRSDPTAVPALQALSDRIRDAVELEAIIASGSRINPARQYARGENEKLMDQLIDNSKKALFWVFTKKYKMGAQEANGLVEMYTTTLQRLYRVHMGEVRRTLRSGATRAATDAGRAITSDEEMGFGKDTYDPTRAFDRRDPAHKIDRLATGPGTGGEPGTGYIDPYVDDMRKVQAGRQRLAALQARLAKPLERAKGKFSEANTELNRLRKKIKLRREKLAAMSEDDKGYSELSREIAQLEKQEPRLAKLAGQAQTALQALQGQLDAAEKEYGGVEGGLTDRAAADLEQRKTKMRKRLHKRLGDEDEDEDDVLASSDSDG